MCAFSFITRWQRERTESQFLGKQNFTSVHKNHGKHKLFSVNIQRQQQFSQYMQIKVLAVKKSGVRLRKKVSSKFFLFVC